MIEMDEYIERNEQIQADMKWKQLMSEYLRSGYWPSEDDCPHRICGTREIHGCPIDRKTLEEK